MIKSLKTGYTEYIVDSLDDVIDPSIIKAYKPNGKGFEQGDRIIFHENGKLCMGVYFSSLNGFVRTDSNVVIEIAGESKMIFEKTATFTDTYLEYLGMYVAQLPDVDITNPPVGWYRLTVDETEYILAYVPHPEQKYIVNNQYTAGLYVENEDKSTLIGVTDPSLVGERNIKLELLGTKFINHSFRVLYDGTVAGYYTEISSEGDYTLEVIDDTGTILCSSAGGLDYFLGFTSFDTEPSDVVRSAVEAGKPITFKLKVSENNNVTEYTFGGVAGTYQETYKSLTQTFEDTYYWGNEFMIFFGS